MYSYGTTTTDSAVHAALSAGVIEVSGYAEVVNPDGVTIAKLLAIGFEVDFRGEQTEQWAATLTTNDPTLVPTGPDSMLDPRSQNRVRLWWSTKTATGWQHTPVGTYRLGSSDPHIVDENGHWEMTVMLRDPLAEVTRAGYRGATIQLGGKTVTEALDILFDELASSEPLQIADTTITLPTPYELGGGHQTPQQDWTAIAETAGWVVRTDRYGTITAGPPPTAAAPVASWQEGPDCKIVSLERTIGYSSMVNRVVATSTNPDVDPPIVAVVEDDDPASPTWVGLVVWETEIQSDAIASEDAARNMASAALERHRRPTEKVVVQIVPPRPDLDYRDTIALGHARSGVAGDFQVSGWRLQVDSPNDAPAAMTVSMMSRSWT